MQRLLYLFLITFFALGVCVPVFACESGDHDKGEEWRKYIDIDDDNDVGEGADAEWRKALKEDDNDASEGADAEWRKALKEDDEDPSEKSDAPWRKAMKEDN